MKLLWIMSPAKGVFKTALSPFKRGLQQIYMSSEMVVDGEAYRLVGIYPMSVLLRMETNFEKFAIVDQTGRLVPDQNVTQRCLRMYQLIVTLDNNAGYLKKIWLSILSRLCRSSGTWRNWERRCWIVSGRSRGERHRLTWMATSST